MKKLSLGLTQAEALVLFEWLARNDHAEALHIEDDAEQQVLWTLEAQLEKQLVEPLQPDCAERLAAARAQVRDRSDHK